MFVAKLKEIWKEVLLLSTWIISVAGTFIIPLPSWTSSDSDVEFYVKFIVFFSTVVAVFFILYSFRNKRIKTWFIFSLIFFILTCTSFLLYSFSRENNTLPYEDKDVIIGDTRLQNDPISKLEAKGSLRLDRDDILKHVHGNSEKIWTKKSIQKNRLQLILLFSASYVSIACFLISFCNLFILHKNNTNKP
ncbi:hypothetical protein [Tenacibaculum xiamenense]|uniref:hypothetical protein n=1 Tax=Tenacibaculum xiamenense TaxID=1261553 RepID=UPI0038938E43